MTMSKHLGRGATALGAIVLVVAACVGPVRGSAASRAAERRRVPAAAGADKPTLAFIAQMQNPSQAFSWKMYQKNAAKYGFNVINLDNKGDVQQQTAAINSAVAQKVAGHRDQPRGRGGLRPRDEGGDGRRHGRVPQHGAARRRTRVDGSTCSVSVDDILGGKTAAEAIIKAFPNGATGVEIGGQAGHVAANNRHRASPRASRARTSPSWTTRTPPRGTPPRRRPSPRT